MAGPYVGSLKLTSGQVLRVYQAATVAVGTYLPVEINGDAVSTSPTDFKVTTKCTAYDFITANTAGIFELVADGRQTGFMVVTDSSQAGTSIRTPLNIPLSPGVKYMLLERVTGAA